MERSIGRETEPTTEGSGAAVARRIDSPEHVAPAPPTPARAPAEGARHLLRDLPPSTPAEDTAVIDLDELQRAADPLDPRRPGRPTGDPLDPEGNLA